jgi:unsaturated rhamnogalacturonyl hydrolase
MGARSSGRSFPFSTSTSRPGWLPDPDPSEFSLVPRQAHGIDATDIDRQIELLIRNVVLIRDTSGEFLLRLPDGRVIDTKGWNDWEWTHGIGLYGILKYYQQTHDPRWHKIMLDWFRDRFAAGPPTKNINTVAPFLTLAYLYEESPNRDWLPYLDEWAEWLMKELPRTEEQGFQHIVFNSENRQQLWDDTLMMSVLPLAKIGQVLNRPRYLEEARRQFMLHVKYLVDRKSGLWFHGWTFDGRHHFANALWARGNCWVTIAIPEFVELLDLPPGDALREFLLETHLQQIRTLVKHQDKGGLWHTLIDDPDSYLEASAAAGFAYGILKSVRLGLIGREFEEAGVRAVKAVLANIDHTGELKNVSFGTPVFNDLDGYRKIPVTSMPYGQAMAILALGEFKRSSVSHD